MKKAIYTLLFPLAAYLILLLHADYLHAVADSDMFVSGQAFFDETLRLLSFPFPFMLPLLI